MSFDEYKSHLPQLFPPEPTAASGLHDDKIETGERGQDSPIEEV